MESKYKTEREIETTMTNRVENIEVDMKEISELLQVFERMKRKRK